MHIHTYMIVGRCGRATGKSLGDMEQSGSQQQPSNAALPPNKITFLLCFPCPLLIPQYGISMEYNLQRIYQTHEHTLDVAQTTRWCVIKNADYLLYIYIYISIYISSYRFWSTFLWHIELAQLVQSCTETISVPSPSSLLAAGLGRRLLLP